MDHGSDLTSTLVVALVLSFVLGAIANRLRQPPLVGYLLAGVLVGPHTPGFVADQALAQQLADIGMILLMFGVGLNFTLHDFREIRGVALTGAMAQMAAATLLGWGFGGLMGWTAGGGLIFGLALSVASTVVLLKWLQDRHLLETAGGRIAVGWLIVEDLAMVLALVLIPAAAGLAVTDHGIDPAPDRTVWIALAVTLVKVGVFMALMLLVGRRIVPALLHYVAHTGSRELFRLSVLATALGIAFGATAVFGVSLALGAFVAGMVLSESRLSSRAAQESLPFHDAFAVLFFVSVGMLFDPRPLLDDPLPVLATVLIIVLGRSAVVFAVMLGFRHAVGTALFVATSRAQIGEFSFILSELGVRLGVLPREGQALILAGAIITIVLSPALYWAGQRLQPALERRLGRPAPPPAAEAAEPAPAAAPPESAEPAPAVAAPAALDYAPDYAAAAPTGLTGHTVLVGFGRVGSVIGRGLEQAGLGYLVIEAADDRVAALKERGVEAFAGNAAASDILALANLAGAATVVIAIPDAFEAGQVAEQARRANPGVRIVARAHSDAEAEHLAALGADIVVLAEREIALGMMDRLGLSRETGEADPAAKDE